MFGFHQAEERDKNRNEKEVILAMFLSRPMEGGSISLRLRVSTNMLAVDGFQSINQEEKLCFS